MKAVEVKADEPRIAVVPIDSLVADAANVRRRDAETEGMLAASVRQFGPARSIVLDGRDIVRAGNGTLKAAKETGITEVIVVEPKPGQLVAVKRDDWSPTEATAYAIADNRLGDRATNDEQALSEQLHSLAEEGFDFEPVGFTADEVEELLGRLGEPDRPEGDVVDDPAGEWQGMPEFQHEDLTSRFKAHVHFRNEADLADFERLVGQKVPRDRWAIWHPKAEIGHYADKEYAVAGADEA